MRIEVILYTVVGPAFLGWPLVSSAYPLDSTKGVSRKNVADVVRLDDDKTIDGGGVLLLKRSPMRRNPSRKKISPPEGQGLSLQQGAELLMFLSKTHRSREGEPTRIESKQQHSTSAVVLSPSRAVKRASKGKKVVSEQTDSDSGSISTPSSSSEEPDSEYGASSKKISRLSKRTKASTSKSNSTVPLASQKNALKIQERDPKRELKNARRREDYATMDPKRKAEASRRTQLVHQQKQVTRQGEGTNCQKRERQK
jgi:hypothetical protein